MFKNYLNPATEPNHLHRGGISPGSSRRSYFYGDPDHQLNHQVPYSISRSVDEESLKSSEPKGHCSKTWIFVGIGIVYLAAIGVVVAVLLLAPKYPSIYFNGREGGGAINLSLHEKQAPFVLVEIDQGIPAEETFPYPFEQPHSSQQKEFIPSPRDEVILYDINPRRRG